MIHIAELGAAVAEGDGPIVVPETVRGSPAELDGQEWLFNWIATGVGSAGDRSAYTLIRVV